jgi:DNA polymerase III alpha subunit (gram-positive type)
MKTLFGSSRPVILGKSLSALDIQLLQRTFGEEFYQKHFHHHTVDVTCVARFLVDAGLLPPGCESTSQIVKHFGIRDVASHTALNDASDMAQIYLKMLEQMKPATK